MVGVQKGVRESRMGLACLRGEWGFRNLEGAIGQGGHEGIQEGVGVQKGNKGSRRGLGSQSGIGIREGSWGVRKGV